MAIPKYRLSFSEEGVRLLATLLTGASPEVKQTMTYFELYKTVGSYVIKLDASIAPAAFIASGVRDPITKQAAIMTSLGVDPLTPQIGGYTPEGTPISISMDLANIRSKEDIKGSKLACYNLYKMNPSQLTADEVLKALDYKQYDLKEPLTPDEQALIDNSFKM